MRLSKVDLILGEAHPPITRVTRSAPAYFLTVVLALGSTIAAAAEPAEPPERVEARALGYAGVRAYAAGDFVLASERLERSFSLLPAPSLGLWSARALVQLGKLVEAEARYVAVTRLRLEENAAEVHRAARATAELELRELLPRLPRVTLSIAGARASEVTITLDGRPWPMTPGGATRWVNPGRHRVVGVRQAQRSEVEFVAAEQAHSQVTMQFDSASRSGAAAAPAAEGTAFRSGTSAWSAAGWTLAGLGAASLAASAAAYAVGRAKYDDLQDDGTCRDDRCRPGGALDAYDRVRRLQTLTLVAGAVFGAAGSTLLVLQWRSGTGTQAVRSELLVGMGSAGIRAWY